MTQNERYYKQLSLIARRTGTMHAFSRPADPLNPYGAAPYQSQMAIFNQDYRFSKPNKYGVAQWYGMFDGLQCQPGDLINGDAGSFFIAAMQNCLPILCVQCNRTVSVLRAQQGNQSGLAGWGGDSGDVETTLMAGWPASILQGTKGEKNDVGLPMDVRTPWFAILLPAYSGIILRTSDIVTDEIGGRYVISSAELTDLGWRLTAMQVRV